MLRFAVLAACALALQAEPVFDAHSASRFVKLALDCVGREYPNKIAHVMNSDADVHPPRELTPAFCGCFDWHSSVHGHWLLARAIRTWPDAEFAAPARAALNRSLTRENLEREAAYMNSKGRESFERPYGLAWLLKLAAELRTWHDPDAVRWSEALRPLERAAVQRLRVWLPKLSHPVRIGEHAQTAFALGFALDYARQTGDKEFAALIEERIRTYYLADRACPVNYEPSGEDFLSPCLGEADAVRRVLPRTEFARWFNAFLPRIPLTPAIPTDRSDGKLAHLDGLNLSRAWMLEAIAEALGKTNTRHAAIARLAAAHREAGLKAVTGEHYEGGHWLGSFAIYLVTEKPGTDLSAPNRQRSKQGAPRAGQSGLSQVFRTNGSR